MPLVPALHPQLLSRCTVVLLELITGFQRGPCLFRIL